MKTSAKKKMVRLFAGVAVLFLWVLLSVIPARAGDDKYWDAGDGDWNVGTNWNPAGVPQNFDKAYLTSSDAASRIVEYYNTNTNMNLNSLWIDATGTGTTMTLNLGGTVGKLITGNAYIGYEGTGVLTQTGGHNGATFYLGYSSGSSGTYNFNGGTMGGHQFIGRYGTGVLTQTGGQNALGETFTLGQYSGGSGTYNLIDGTILGGMSSERIGSHGTGVFIQSGGTHTTGEELILGHGATGEGTYELSGGTLTAGEEVIGEQGTGVFTQSGGTHEAIAGLYLSTYEGSSGTYELSAGTLTASYETIGMAGTGIFTQTGGTNTVTYDFNVGHSSGGTGTYNLTGAQLTAETIDVTGNGQMHLSGGTVSAGSGGMTNGGLVTMTGAPNTINGDVDNHGTFKATDTTVTFTGTYTENGIYMSDPSTSNFNDWVIGYTGVVGGGAGDVFNVSGDFINHSLMSSLWDTDQALLGFVSGTDHDFYLTGLDVGADMLGYSDNFAWGTLFLDDEDSIHLFDGNTVADGALYVTSLLGADIFEDTVTNILFGGGDDLLNIYYLATGAGNAYLAGLTYSLTGGGQLIPIGTLPPAVPIPGAVWLLGTGLIGLVGLRRKSRK